MCSPTWRAAPDVWLANLTWHNPEVRIRPPQGPWPYLILDPVVVDGHAPVVEIARERFPALEAVIQSVRDA